MKHTRFVGLDVHKDQISVAVAESEGLDAGLAIVDGIEGLDDYRYLHATRADLLRRLGRSQQSRAAYDRAIELAGNSAEIAYLSRRRDQLGRS